VVEAISLPRSYSPALIVGRSDSMHADGSLYVFTDNVNRDNN
jgi:hypothetical protein